MAYQVRHGDVFLERVEALPAEAARQNLRGDVILAEGEVTGHAHRIGEACGVSLWSVGEQRYIEVPTEGAALTHEEHGRIDLPAGCYRLVLQREYSPEGLRNVAD